MELLILIPIFTATLAVAYIGERLLLAVLFRAINRTDPR
jgi:hypothetical protein